MMMISTALATWRGRIKPSFGENGENIAPQYNVVNDPDSETPSDNAHKVELR
jgi:hypothetical protein